MSDDTDPTLRSTEQRVADLSRRVEIDLQHKTRLREELLRRHQELTATTTQRTAVRLEPRKAGLRRLTLVAPAALAAAAALVLSIGGLQLLGHQHAPAAEAAPIIRALSHTVPTVTGWQVTVHEVRNDVAASCRSRVPLRESDSLYIRTTARGSGVYLYSGGRWYQVTGAQSSGQCEDWQWMFAVLSTMGQRSLQDRTGRPIDGQPIEILSYTDTLPGRQRAIHTTMWVERNTGLVRHLETVTRQDGRVVERDSADYRYAYRRVSVR